MQIYVKVKAIGRRKDVLQPRPYTIPDDTGSLRRLLEAVVEAEVKQYNSKTPGAQLIAYLTEQQLGEQAAAGKLSFGTVFSSSKARVDKALENAVQCWQDGLVRVFMDGAEITELDAELHIPEGAEFTFMRLSFLAGRMW